MGTAKPRAFSNKFLIIETFVGCLAFDTPLPVVADAPATEPLVEPSLLEVEIGFSIDWRLCGVLLGVDVELLDGMTSVGSSWRTLGLADRFNGMEFALAFMLLLAVGNALICCIAFMISLWDETTVCAVVGDDIGRCASCDGNPACPLTFCWR